jgi:glycosyltransferase involved in cell wall biosynthesis
MNLCVVTSSFPANASDSRAAAGLFVRDFCLALAAQGHRVSVVTQDVAGVEKIIPSGLEVCWYPWRGDSTGLGYLRPWRPRDVLASISVLREGRKVLERMAKKQEFDHVLAMWAVPAGWLARGLKRRFGIPYSVWALGSDIWIYGRYPILRQAVRASIAGADHVYADGIALAEETRRLSGRDCPFLPSSRRLDKSLIRPIESSQAPGPHFLFVGRYAPVKGVDVLLEAMARYRATGGDGRLTMFGGGPLEAFVRERASQPDLKDCVTVHGFADEATYVSNLAGCDLSLIPSRMESIPVVLSDALQMGKPVVASDVGDMGRLLRETPAGLVVPAGDAQALCRAMIQFASSGSSTFADSVSALASRFDLNETARRWVADIRNDRN